MFPASTVTDVLPLPLRKFSGEHIFQFRFASINLFRMFQEGVDPNKINDLSTKAGFAVGTATLIDEVGVDIAMHAATNIGCNPMYGARMNGGDVAFLEKLNDAGYGGKKTKKGVFDYSDKKKKGVVSDGFKKLQSEVSVLSDQITEGCLLKNNIYLDENQCYSWRH